MSRRALRRSSFYFVIFLFLALDYFSFSSGVSWLEQFKKSGLLTFLFPTIYIFILVTAITAVKGKFTDLGWARGLILLATLILSATYFSGLKDETHKVHFLEYELITLIFFKALEMDIKTKFLYLATLFATIILGATEEIFQASFPDRNFDVGDLKINLFSSLLMICIFYLFREKS